MDKTLFSEPVGSSAPKFSNDEKSATYVRHESMNIALLCSAQAFPYPSFRYKSMYYGPLFVKVKGRIGLEFP